MQIEGTFRAHQVPILVDAEHPEHVALLESWMKSYKAEELFDEKGRLMPELAELAPKGDRRMGANPHANGGIFAARPDHAGLPRPCGACAVAGSRRCVRTRSVLGEFLRDVAKLNQDRAEFPRLRSRRDAFQHARRGV